jgi:oligopeptide transport system ATP-binding protein
MGTDKRPLVDVKNLKKYFQMPRGSILGENVYLQAVDDVSFHIDEGETLGLVGESGCGKTTCGRTMIRLYEPTFGHMYFEGQDIFKLSSKQMIPIKQKMQMIFQDPYSSLNPRMTVSDIIGEPLEVHSLITNRKERLERIYELLNLVGLTREHANRFPHEFSGGQCQRIGIARALAVNPKFIICDEPISALDVSIQAQVVNLLEELQEQFKLTYLFIAHDLAMVKHISVRIAVMYLGKVVELANKLDLYDNPLHPYTQALLSAIPIPDPDVERQRQRIILEGEVPTPINPPRGCRFRTRCKYMKPECAEEPPLKDVGGGHMVACHLI